MLSLHVALTPVRAPVRAAARLVQHGCSSCHASPGMSADTPYLCCKALLTEVKDMQERNQHPGEEMLRCFGTEPGADVRRQELQTFLDVYKTTTQCNLDTGELMLPLEAFVLTRLKVTGEVHSVTDMPPLVSWVNTFTDIVCSKWDDRERIEVKASSPGDLGGLVKPGCVEIASKGFTRISCLLFIVHHTALLLQHVDTSDPSSQEDVDLFSEFPSAAAASSECIPIAGVGGVSHDFSLCDTARAPQTRTH